MKDLIGRLLGKSDEDSALPGTPYPALGGTIVFVGLAVFSPGVKDALLAFANNAWKLGLSLDAPWWVGLSLLSELIWTTHPSPQISLHAR